MASDEDDFIEEEPPPQSPFEEARDRVVKRLAQYGVSAPPNEEITPKTLNALYQLLEALDVSEQKAEKRKRRIDRLEEKLTSSQLTIADFQRTPDVELAREDMVTENTALKTALERAQEAAATDYLTELYTRRAFERAVQNRIARMHDNSAKGAASIIYFDLNFLKPTNDSIGRSAGDAMLKRVAEVLQNHTQEHGHIPGRIGGDEFAILLYNKNASEAERIAGRIVKELKRTPVKYRDDKTDRTYAIPISLAYGVCEIDSQKRIELPPGTQQPNAHKRELHELTQSFMDQADSNMLQQKRGTKDEETAWFLQNFKPPLTAPLQAAISERRQHSRLLEGPDRNEGPAEERRGIKPDAPKVTVVKRSWQDVGKRDTRPGKNEGDPPARQR